MLEEKELKRYLIRTEDGSSSLFVPQLNEHYHSIHGAMVESHHVYIEAGLHAIDGNKCKLLEAGFGTGLNAILTLIDCSERRCNIEYHSYEKYPLTPAEYEQLNYADYLPAEYRYYFNIIHEVHWNELIKINDYFSIHKHHADFYAMHEQEQFDLIYYDAFNPDVQPHLWGQELLQQFYQALKPGGMLTTYCVKGVVKQALRATGFIVKRLPGPPGKRHMLRAIKQDLK